MASDGLAPLKALYKERHPGSFWVEFGDFHWFQMTSIAAARVVGGFARAGSVRTVQPEPSITTLCHIMSYHISTRFRVMSMLRAAQTQSLHSAGLSVGT